MKIVIGFMKSEVIRNVVRCMQVLPRKAKEERKKQKGEKVMYKRQIEYVILN